MKIQVRGLRKTFQDADRQLSVIEDLSAQFVSPASVAIVGKSGIGKSTLLHLLGGLEEPSAGTVLYDDIDMFALSHDERSLYRGETIGFIFQMHNLLPEFDALENVAMPLIIDGLDEEEAMYRAKEILVRVELQKRMSHRPSQLSGGEQQRVAIARAVVNCPKVVLADEPTGNLDASSAKEVQDLLLELRQELGNLLIVVTHNPELAGSMDVGYRMMPGGMLRKL